MNVLLDPSYSANQKRILSAIYASNSSTRQSIAAATGLSILTVTKTVANFIDKGILLEKGKLSSTGGRKANVLCLRPDIAYVLCVDIGTSATRIGIVNVGGKVVYKEEQSYFKGEYPVIALSPEQLRDKLLQICDAHKDLEIIGIHICISGLVDSQTHEIIFCPNIHGYDGVDLVQYLSAYIDIPISLDTSARTMTLAVQHFGVGQSIENLVYISVGYSVSAGIIINGRLITGTYGFAGEIGHIYVSDAIDNVCTCGNQGCLELYVTFTAILDRIRSVLANPGIFSLLKPCDVEDNSEQTIENVRHALRNGDKVVYSVITQVGEELGKIVTDITNLLNPEMIVLGGGTIQTLDVLVAEVDRTVRQKALIPNQRNLEIKQDNLGFDCALIGGVVQVLNRIF